MSCVSQSTAGWQAGFLSMLPAVETHAKIRFRKLPAERREEAVQEAVAAACMNYQSAIAQGKLDAVKAGPLADFAVRHVREGRHVGGKQDAARDVLSPACQRRQRVTILSFDARQADSGTDGWRQVAIEDRRIPIPDLAAFRIDFADWLQALSARDRKIIGGLLSGERTQTVAERFGITEGRVSQLRRRYERNWLDYQGEAA